MKHHELIERYFLGQLSSEEKEQFRHLQQTDASFKAELTFQENIKRITENEDNIHFKEQLQSYETKQPSKAKSYRLLWMAASVAVAVTVGALLFFQSPSNKALFAENFEPYRNVIQPIVRGEASKDLKTQAFSAYEKKDFTKAISLFSALQKTEPEPYYLFYKANSYLVGDQPSEAIPLLKEYLSTQGNFTEKAQWYLALAYLKDGNTSEAKKILQKISDSKSYHFQKATILLKKIK